jgi:hypothetical protein
MKALDRDLAFLTEVKNAALTHGSGGGHALRAVGRAWKSARGAATEIAAGGRREIRKHVTGHACNWKENSRPPWTNRAC